MDDYATNAARDLLAERFRQFEEYGFTFEHDDRNNTNGELARAAIHYAADPKLLAELGRFQIQVWPFPEEMMEHVDRRTELVMAGALILAEIERLDRAKGCAPLM